jgi:uncharacterized integral membrane protein
MSFTPLANRYSNARRFSHATIDRNIIVRAGRLCALEARGFETMDLLSSNIAIFALLDLLALFASLVFVWRGLRRASRFARLSARTSFGLVYRRARHIALRQAYRCATDESYYLSRLAIFWSANLVGGVAMIIAVIGATIEPDAMARLPLDTWRWIANFFVLLFAAFTVRSLARTTSLARRVMEVRRRLRLVSRRRARLAGA